ncbi:1-acyl-sn-glycerol-3-phosphate acyltransferase delta-like [Diorhabda carinulata]|uniref:1-acyl-sn-glycerol-3-phosphate acyltransferase delta-like n=1 Tax=Diorhabda sublineata TaxID=1163346 RepID=UPI0024E08ADC|nr:1-acyl-sn-glycerol-3-phosphate acyltransferase delta-like [Diorhabda sublineata]XP_057653097.1 1-acyl-sn-glycerol-3-phosphate acyltransferase delta-like [Diorhabda carinulata]
MDLKVLKRSRLIHLCLAITFFTSGIIVNLVQCILYLCLRPFNKWLYRKINWYLCYTIYSQLVCLGDWWSQSKIYVYTDKKVFDKYFGKEHAYCIMNHTYEVDWLIGWMITDKLHLLGNCKAYAKKVIQYIPVLGWAWKCSEFVFLERNFDKDKEIINKQITELSEHPDPMWLLLFPEGTRFTTKKHEASIEFAIKNNLPQLKHHLLPRTKGFIASLPAMKGKVPAIYNCELAFNEDDPIKPTITNMLLGKSVSAHIYFERTPLENLPNDPQEQETWLRDMFIRKDKMRESFLKTGDFFTASGVPRMEPFELSPRIESIVNLIVWQIVTLVPISYYLVKLLFSGEILYFSVGVGIIATFFLLLNKTIGMSEIDKGSSYGTETTPKKTH